MLYSVRDTVYGGEHWTPRYLSQDCNPGWMDVYYFTATPKYGHLPIADTEPWSGSTVMDVDLTN